MPTHINFRLTRQRAATRALLAALEAAPEALRMDLGGQFRIRGPYGHAYPLPHGGCELVVYSRERHGRAKRFLRARRLLARAGGLELRRASTPDEARAVRVVLGVDSPPRAAAAAPTMKGTAP